MPRNGSGVYSLPAIYIATTGQTITAIQHNSPLTDIAADLNTARSIATGGTGATTASQALANLGGRSKTNGSFSVGITGTSATFSGLLTANGNIEIGAGQSVDTLSYVDLHATPGEDYEARISRSAGANGKFQIIQTGTGDIEINGGGAFTRDGDGVVLDTRSVSAAGLASGGGDLSDDRTITVTAATQAQAEAGTANTVAMTPLRTKQAIAALAPSTGPSGSWISFGTVGSFVANSWDKDILLRCTGTMTILLAAPNQISYPITAFASVSVGYVPAGFWFAIQGDSTGNVFIFR